MAENAGLLNFFSQCKYIDYAEKAKNTWSKLKGYILTMVFAFCSCASGVLVRKSYTLSGADAAVIRYLVQFITMLSVARFYNLNPLGNTGQRKLLLLRGVAGMTSLLCSYFAIKYINPSDFKAIHHSSIIITAVLAKVFLKEKLSMVHVIALILTLVGVLLISQPSFVTTILVSGIDGNQTTLNSTLIKDEDYEVSNVKGYLVIGLVFSICAAFGSGSARVILKQLSLNDVHFSVATIYASYYGLPVSLAISMILVASGVSHRHLSRELKHFPEHIFYASVAGLIGVIGQCMLNYALKYEDASKLAIVKTIDVFYAFILQYLFLSITANTLSVIGAVTILSGSFLVLICKMVENRDWVDESEVPEVKEKSEMRYTNF